VISENFMVPGGQPLAILERIRNAYPIVMHGVSMSIASTAPLDRDYLAALKALAERFQPEWITDQLQRENRIKMRVTPKTTPIPEGPWIHLPHPPRCPHFGRETCALPRMPDNPIARRRPIIGSLMVAPGAPVEIAKQSHVYLCLKSVGSSNLPEAVR
jgi:hypothetical protein